MFALRDPVRPYLRLEHYRQVWLEMLQKFLHDGWRIPRLPNLYIAFFQ